MNIWLSLPFLLPCSLAAAATGSKAGVIISFDDAFRLVSNRHIAAEEATAFEHWYGERDLQQGVKPKSR